MGGYMGLLLGASVMTLCEVLDLILYNWARKLKSKKKVGDSSQADLPTHDHGISTIEDLHLGSGKIC